MILYVAQYLIIHKEPVGLLLRPIFISGLKTIKILPPINKLL